MALWVPTAPAVVSPNGLAQPDAATWNAYLPSLDSAVRVVPRRAESATIESATLWLPAPKNIKREAESASTTGLWGTAEQESQTPSLPGMWERPRAIEKVFCGLSQPEQRVWKTYLAAAEPEVRAKRRKVTPASIESSQLWSAPPVIRIAPSTEFLWSAPRFITVAPLQEAVNFGMWTAPAAVEHEESEGLFSLSHKRSDYRTSSLEPAALDMDRKPRPAPEPFASIGFAYLWNESPLWRGPKVVVEEQAEGLFSLNHRRTNFRTTSEAPAALGMIRKPRASNEPLPRLTSNTLWSASATRVSPHDRTALSSTGPRRASATSSASDNESLSTGSTEATSVDNCVMSSVKDTAGDIIAASIRRIEATAAQWKDALDEAIHVSKADNATAQPASKSALLKKRSKPADVTSTTPQTAHSTSRTASIGQPSSTSTTERELEYTIARSDFTRSTTLPSCRKSEDDPTTSTALSYSNFLDLTDPETPRDFSAQALWTPGEQQIWVNESAYGRSSVLQLS